MKITTGKVFFKSNTEADEQVATPHLLDLDLCLSGTPVALGYWDHGPAVTANNGFQWNLNRYIEVTVQYGVYFPASIFTKLC